MIDREEYAFRRVALNDADEYVRSVEQTFPVEKVRGAAANVFVAGPTFTEIDQHIDHTVRIADWLLHE